MEPKDATITLTLELDIAGDWATTERERKYHQQTLLLAPELTGTVRLRGGQAAVIANLIALFALSAKALEAYHAVHGREEGEVPA